jgi:hypothetical protein
MELSSPEVIAQLLAFQKTPEPGRRARAYMPGRDKIESIGKRPARKAGRCRCGQCRQCLDNARWERIFNEKFADPYYYDPRPVRHASSLDWLR